MHYTSVLFFLMHVYSKNKKKLCHCLFSLKIEICVKLIFFWGGVHFKNMLLIRVKRQRFTTFVDILPPAGQFRKRDITTVND